MHPVGCLLYTSDIALFEPSLGNGHDAGLQLLAVVRAVVHADHGQRGGTVLETLQQQGGDHAHGVACVGRALVDVSLDDRHQGTIGTIQGVALLGDGEGCLLYTSWLEHSADNREVDGSSPFQPTTGCL